MEADPNPPVTPMSLATVNKIMAGIQIRALEAEREHLRKHPMVLECVFPGCTAASLEAIDHEIAFFTTIRDG